MILTLEEKMRFVFKENFKCEDRSVFCLKKTNNKNKKLKNTKTIKKKSGLYSTWTNDNPHSVLLAQRGLCFKYLLFIILGKLFLF